MIRVALIGAGQLGSRHLQGLAQININAQIEVVDPSSESLRLSRARFEEMECNQQIRSVDYYDSISMLSQEIDVAIVASNSNVRFQIVKDLLDNKKVKNLVLEKVLFQKPQEYYEMSGLLREHEVNCWVNHPRRMSGFYQKLKNELKNSEILKCTVEGGDWGLACNGLHFLDLIAFLKNDQGEFTINTDYLEKSVYPSKRKGYVEFYGELKAKLGDTEISMNTFKSAVPLLITIYANNMVVLLDEANGFSRTAKLVEGRFEWQSDEEKIIFYQSELSHFLVEEIVKSGKSQLPLYEMAAKNHLSFINALLKKIENINGGGQDYCPIT